MSKILARTFLVFTPLFLLITVASIIILSTREKLEMEMYRSTEENIINSRLGNIQEAFSNTKSDLLVLSSNSNIVKLFENPDNSDVYAQLTQDFFNVIHKHNSYDQGRLIDENGMERIRINYNKGNTIIIPKEKLQDKKDRYYFTEAFKLNRNEIFISPLDLNIENGKIEQPLKPMIRIASPVFDKEGEKRGIVLLNYFGQKVLNQLQSENISKINSTLMLLNKEGYFLKGESPAEEWGFMYDDKKDLTFSNLYQDAWIKIKNEASSQFMNKRGLFTFTTIYPLDGMQNTDSTIVKSTLIDETPMNTKDYYWKIVSYIPSEALYSVRDQRRRYVALLMTLVFLSLFYLLWRLTRAQYLREVALKELKKSNDTKDKFFSIIAHDLRSPFNAMLGFSNMLNDEFDNYNEKERREFFGIIHKSIINLHRLLDNLLLWSRTQLGKYDFNPERVNLYLLIKETNEILDQLAKNKTINITNQIPKDLEVYADKEMLSTIIRNLISNAIKFTPKNGEISITVSSTKNRKFSKIAVQDNGIGMSKEIQSKLFDMSESHSRKGTDDEIGTGLGLVICKEFVEKHQGEIWIESEVGKGSIFYFTIPVS